MKLLGFSDYLFDRFYGFCEFVPHTLRHEFNHMNMSSMV